MPSLPSLTFPLLLLMPSSAHAQEIMRFRQWMDGRETGGVEIVHGRLPEGERIEEHEWTQMERMGTTIRQETTDTAIRMPDGSVKLTWKIKLSAEPLQGEALWSSKVPGTLHITVKGAKPLDLDVPAGAILWPDDGEMIQKQAARELRPVHVTEFATSVQQWATTDLEPVGPEPLPGFPDTVHFHGQVHMGKMTANLDSWISPHSGEVKHVDRLAGLTVLTQRSELPAPTEPPSTSGFFQRTLAQLPPHPFLPWVPEAILHWEGPGSQELPQDDQQMKLGPNRYRVHVAQSPNPKEAAELPVQGPPNPEDAPFLAQSSLVQYQDPVFDGLLARMHPPRGASRWELARQVTTFVFDWITEKDMSVGFASAQEVARIPRGDCTEHGVLAVALLRRLGVPARGVVGWVGLGDVLGLHFWVEVKLVNRWVPVDPTFDEAPASAVRLKVATTNLSDLGSIGWEMAGLSFVDGAWVPENPWASSIRVDGDSVQGSGVRLRIPDGGWNLKDGHLRLLWEGSHDTQAVTRPFAQQLEGARLLRGAGSGRRGWWMPRARTLWMELNGGRWLQMDKLDETSAFKILDLLETHF